MIPDNHSLKILWKCKHFPQRYKGKQKGVFFSEYSVCNWARHLRFLFPKVTLHATVQSAKKSFTELLQKSQAGSGLTFLQQSGQNQTKK